MRIAHRFAGFGHRTTLISHQGQGVAHAAAQTVVENGLAENGLEALGERGLRHPHGASELGDGRRGCKLAHEQAACSVQTFEFALGVLLVRRARGVGEALHGGTQQLECQRLGVDQRQRSGKRVVEQPRGHVEGL